MLYYLSKLLMQWAAGTAYEGMVRPLRLVHYITFRMAGAAVTALLLSWWLGPVVIRWLKELKFGQNYQDKAEQQGEGIAARVISKKGTPTMGGVLIVVILDIT